MMPTKSFLAFAVVMMIIGPTEGCYHRNIGATEGSSPDSASGIVSVTGTMFEHHLVLRTISKPIPLIAGSADSMALTNLAGVEVLVRGDLSDGTMRVKSFTAMRVDGAPVVDGVVIDNGGRLFLKTSSGTLLVGNPPAKLREMISARVWIGGPLDKGPNNYGVIVPSVVRP